MSRNRFSRNVVIFSVVSFLNDLCGETIKRAIPLYLSNIVGVKMSVIGLVEGIAESAPHLLQPFSGYLSDLVHKRKPIVVTGQILRSTMLMLFWAVTWPQVLLLRFLDRSGKGLANAPRDALIAASTSSNHEGRSFGLNRAMDDAGSVVGMVIASFIVGTGAVLSRSAFQKIVRIAFIPLFISLALLVFFLRDIPDRVRDERFVLHDAFGHKYYLFLLFSFLFTLGNSSDAFFVLKAQTTGFTLGQIFLLLAALNLIASLSGYPLSNLSDSIGRKRLLVAGWLVYAFVYLLFAVTQSQIVLVAAALLYGLYYGLTQGVSKALVADVVSPHRRGTAYGIYNMVVGVTLFPASLIAGYLWQTIAPSAAFFFGSGLSAFAALGLAILL